MTTNKDNSTGYSADLESGEFIHVDYVASKVSLLYEKIRHAIDYQEEHLLRENAIERSIRRRLLLTRTPQPFALELIEELIHGGYFPNDVIPQSSTARVQEILDRYIGLLRVADAKQFANKDFSHFIFGIAACEIEEFLDPPHRELLLLEFEYETLRNQIKISGPQIGEGSADMLLFIAVNQTLLRAGQRRIYFRLMQKMYPLWFEKREAQVEEYSPMILRAKSQLDSLVQHPALSHIRNRVRQFALIFHTLSDISANDPNRLAELARNPAELANAIQQSYTERFDGLRSKMRRAGFRSVLSIFLGKILVALAAEIPFEFFLTGHIMFYNLALSVVFPPSLMLFAVLTVRMPPWRNYEELKRRIEAILTGSFRYDPIVVRARKRGAYTSAIIGVLYFGIFAFSLWGITSFLRSLSFNLLGIAIFFIFFSLVIFSITRIKQRAKELYVGPEQEGIFGFIFDVFSFPIVSFGKFLSGELSRFNVLILLFNLAFEAPFQSFVQFVEEWRKFIREKKEELQ